MNTTRDDGGSAFPHSSQPLDRQGNPICENHSEWGMSLRDWFAGMALQGIFASDRLAWDQEDWSMTAAFAYQSADAMIAARKDAP